MSSIDELTGSVWQCLRTLRMCGTYGGSPFGRYDGSPIHVHHVETIPTTPACELKISFTQKYIDCYKEICAILEKKPWLLNYVPMHIHTPEMVDIVLNKNPTLVNYVNPLLVNDMHIQAAFSGSNMRRTMLINNYSFLQHLHESLLERYQNIICEKLYDDLFQSVYIRIQLSKGSSASHRIIQILFYRCAEHLQYLGKDCMDIIWSYTVV